jgi:hypothetical protein
LRRERPYFSRRLVHDDSNQQSGVFVDEYFLESVVLMTA